ncbi:MAG TPA: hypothetical protein VIJ31_10625 [Acidothermaceae bacterium]
MAIGSGDMVALGAMYALAPDDIHDNPAHVVTTAIVAATTWRTDVGGSILIEHAAS